MQVQRKGGAPNRRKSRKKLAVNITVLLLSLVMLVAGITLIYGEVLLQRVQYVDDGASRNQLFASTAADSGTDGASGVSMPSGSGVKLVNGLYHDDMVVNVLIMGVYDYQPNDPGRTDSMMLVSIDTRNQELKVTSLMRDLYVAIPGKTQSNRLNTAYSSGGAPLLVRTVEANFGIDVDRWVVIDFDAFNQIIDAMGGVEITLTQAEAQLVNENSGDPRRNLSEGTYVLSGAQARYYSRIRAIGDDFERTERQRNVFSSIINKFKDSDIGTINNVLYNTLNLVHTNMDKNEILSLAANSLTYMNYELLQNRIPADGEYTPARVQIGGSAAAVLVPDLDACSKNIRDFIYGDN